ncbi:MAG: GNAT family N-acetyltransferase [Gemmatimonadales bacterium]
MSAPRIRDMTAADAPRVAALLGQLGYPSPAASVPERLARMMAERTSLVVVAELDGAITGVAAGHVTQAITSDEPLAFLMALVVDEGSRGSRVGRALVAHVEAWAKQEGAHKLQVLTATYREAAHRFYEHLGYQKNGYRYIRTLE